MLINVDVSLMRALANPVEHEYYPSIHVYGALDMLLNLGKSLPVAIEVTQGRERQRDGMYNLFIQRSATSNKQSIDQL